ncbi:MAG: IS4 family transposase, partial [Verrucomicrobia bacterium]|nr:IS4 family transposase [Verrucomicrobiota bacterium]
MALAGPVVRLIHVGQMRRRVFTAATTFWLFLSQVLGPARACPARSGVRNAQAWLTQTDLSPSTSAYCQARARLSQTMLDKLLAHLVDQLPHHGGARWMGRLVTVVDGTTLSMPDTPDNQRAYPQSSRQRPGCGFPTMRLAALFSLATGALVGVASGSLHVHERTLWRGLWPLMENGSVVLADRGFCGFADYCLLLERGVDAVMRLHARRSTGVRTLARLAPGDWLVEWKKTNICPKWMSTPQWRALPDVLRVRHIRVPVAVAGFRTRVLTLATTILDAKAYPAPCFADLYRRRWMAELFLRDIKITMGMDI